MSYSTLSHVAHDSNHGEFSRPPGGYPGIGPGPPPPPRPGFEQGYGPVSAPGLGYQSYFRDNNPPQVAHVYHSGPGHRPFEQPYDYSFDSGGPSAFLRACLAGLCCCCLVEQCCPRW